MENNESKDAKVESNKCKVLIIGAGIAGLSAAYHLSKNGFKDFKILEARSRIGGRVVQIQLGSEKIELGANWIHGVLGNPVYELAMQNGLVDILAMPKPHEVVATTERGKQVPFATLQEIYEAYICFLKRCEEYFISQYLPPDGIESVGDHIKLEISLYLDKIKDKHERDLRKLIFDCLLKRETCISGCDDMSEIDLMEIGTYTELQGGNITLPNGYSSILEPISAPIPPDLILLEHAVSAIKWSRGKSKDYSYDSDDSDRTVIEEASSCEKASHVEVTCENGEIFHADQLICTIPLGVLKSKANAMFQPSLPAYKVDAIDRLLFGTVNKIILEYDRPFLRPNITEVLLLWEPESAERRDDFSKTWFKKIYSFSKITETLMLGWISGKEAEYMETLHNDVVAKTCTNILRKFLCDPYIPKPKTCVCTSWASQPYTRGSYTAIAVGASQIDIECLAQPLYMDDDESKPVVLFAGEHTHTNFYSTVHGAYLTGRTVAQIVMTPETGSADDEIIVDCEEATDLSSWIQGINLE
ncbi:unnamed protein product [Brassicogethes aeneus]|uniref:Amine oxidase domain-containing protein n=1 Tax=Brassicogethes aeneus TaxID=1431903 RepID=A0A9P0B481_BRAAE|nr:unnamed protein product [Brassicogethes aeneus]